MMGKLKKLTGYRLFLPLSCLIIVLLINLITTPTFFRITINNGVLYGYIIDVINRASELVVLAVGMTLVVSASAGTDISVGAVMAVAAAVCTRVLAGGEVSVNEYANPYVLAVLAALAAAVVCGGFNGFLVAGKGNLGGVTFFGENPLDSPHHRRENIAVHIGTDYSDVHVPLLALRLAVAAHIRTASPHP